MAGYFDIIKGLKSKVGDFFSSSAPTTATPPPADQLTEEDKKAADKKTVDYAKILYKDSKNARDQRFRDTSHLRTDLGPAGKSNLDNFWRACDALEANRDWDVIGHRNIGAKNTWKQERVEGEITRQMRARTSYLTANWHDVIVMPNINNISDILDEERKTNGWSKFMRTVVKSTQKYGESWTRIILDKTCSPPIIKPIYCEVGSVYLSPLAKSLDKRDGCWYLIHETTMTGQSVKDEYGIEPSEVDLAQKEKLTSYPSQSSGTYDKTAFYTKLEFFLDDATLKKKDFTPDEQAAVDQENSALSQGVVVDVDEFDNHVEHIQRHLAVVTDLTNTEPQSDEDLASILAAVDAFNEHIQDHLEASKDDDHPGMELVYPYGRHLCVVGDKLASDVPNPYNVPWRTLFRKVLDEEVVGREDGRGEPEMLYEREKMMSTMLSRIDDMAISVLNQKPWLHENDRRNVAVDGMDNDPTKPAFYSVRPPVFPKGAEIQAYYELYRFNRTGAQNDIGVNDVVHGKTPTSQASNALAETLLQQSEQQITGELNLNLTDFVKEVVETMLELYKVFYTEKREYFIQGEAREINVSEALRFHSFKDEFDKEKTKEIKKFRVEVKPNSNFPNKWEDRLNMLLAFSQRTEPDGTPMIPPEFIRRVMSEKFPELGPNGDYYHVSEVYKRGIQALQEDAAAQEAAQTQRKSFDDAQNEVMKSKIKGLSRQPQATTPTNGSPVA
jgi:hypothetical protein